MKLNWLTPQRLPGWESTLLSLMLIWAFGFSSFSSSINAIFYDFYSAYLPSTTTSAAKTVLIEVDYDKRDLYSAQLETLVHKVLDEGGKQVVFLFPPHFSPDFSNWASLSKRVIVGLRAVSDVNLPNGFRLTDDLSAIKSSIPAGLVLIDYHNHGVYSTQLTTSTLNGTLLPTVEFLAAQQAGSNLKSDQTYWINFTGGLASLPRLSLEDALKGNIVPELVAGRTILIGLKGGNEQVGINFPGGSKLEMATSNEYHAFALNTLLNNSAILHPSSWQQLALLAVFTLMFFMAYQPTSVKYILSLSLIISLAYGLLCWLLLGYFKVWLPLTEIILLHIATLSMVYHNKGKIESRKLERMLVETSAKLNDKLLPSNFTDSQEHWAYVITMVEQMLSLSRIIFLERIPGDHRVREIKSLHCNINDIDEMRRDYERTPYSTSLKQKSPLETKNYLKTKAGIDERQFMLPLVLGGEVLGFWSFGILAEKLAADTVILARAEALSEQISLLLYQRKVHQEREQGEKRKWGRFLVDWQSTALSDLRNAIDVQEKRLATLEHLFAGLTTAAILYDFFGRVVLVNAQMNALLQVVNLNPYTMTAVDLITALSNTDRDSARNYIQQSVFEMRQISKHISMGSEPPRYYQLSLRAIRENLSSETTASGELLHSEGLLVELVDISDIYDIHVTKLQLVERLKYLINNDIAALSAASTLLKNPNLSALNKDIVVATIDTKIKSASDALNKTLEYLAENFFSKSSERYPVNVLESLQMAIDSSQQVAGKRRIMIETVMPHFVSFAIASQPEIYNAFQTILKYLLDDTVEDGKIKVTMIERGNSLQISLENDGMGIPQDKLDEFLFGPSEVSSTTFKQLRETLRYVKHWGGELQVVSNVGNGTHFKLILETFF